MNKYAYLGIGFLLGICVAAGLFSLSKKTNDTHKEHKMVVANFEPLSGGYATGDDGNVYFYNQLVYAADPETFEVLDFDYAKDKNYVFYDGRVINQVDPETFEVIGYIMGKDKRGVYTYDRRETNLRPEKTTYIGNYYTLQEGRGIYYMNRFTTVREDSFEILPYDSAATDGVEYYYRGQRVSRDYFDNEEKWEFAR